MKKLMILLLAIGLAAVVSAQRVMANTKGSYADRDHDYYHHPRTTYIVRSYAPFYSPWYYGPYTYYPYYPYYGYPPYYNYRYDYHNNKLDLQIQDIRNDYADKIWNVRHNDSLSGKEKRKEIHELRHERDKAIIEAEKNYSNK